MAEPAESAVPPRTGDALPPKAVVALEPLRSTSGGVGRSSRGQTRRVSTASEATPLFLHGLLSGKPLVLDENEEAQYFPGRWKATLEVVVSKIFWDGFLWEWFAYLAARLHAGPQTLAFAVLTGLGAGIGVGVGQLAYASGVYAVAALSSALAGQPVPTARTLLMGLEFAALLSVAAFWTGCCWQPVVNALQLWLTGLHDASPSGAFVVLLLGTWLVEAVVFFVSLHATRYVMHSLLQLEAVDGALTESSLVYDYSLSLSIGCASGFFVATTGQAYADNALTRAFGVSASTGGWAASSAAGGSMVLGFLLAQAVQNAAFPANTSWADSRKKGRQQLRYTRSEVLLPYRTPYG